MHASLFRLLTIVAATLWASVGFATTIIKPTSAPDFESQYLPDGRFAEDSRNGVGLAIDLETGDPAPGVYPLHNSNWEDQWLTAVVDTDTWITYDLGAEYVVSGFHQWNYNEGGGGGRGANAVELTFSTTSALAGFGSSHSTTFGQASGLSHAGETQSLPDYVVARWVRLDINSNHGGNHTGLAEIRFLAPDPGILAATPADDATITITGIESFQTTTLTDAIELENIGGPDTAIAITGFTINGPDALQFDLSDYADTILASGESVEFDVEFTSLSSSVNYNAVLTIHTSLGDVTYNLFATAVPEPSTLALCGLAGLGLAWQSRRRRLNDE